MLTCALRSTPCRIRRSVQDSPKGVSTTWPQRRLPGRLGRRSRREGQTEGSRAERRWQRLQSRQRSQPVACVSQATMALEGVRAPNLGPMWAQRPRLAITERLHAIGRLLHPRSRETHRPIPSIWGSRGADSNLASPTRRWRIVTPDHTRVQPVTGPSSTSLSAGGWFPGPLNDDLVRVGAGPD